MPQTERHSLEAVIFDWAGTLVDFGAFAPVQVLVDAFDQFGVEVTLNEARLPMGLSRWDHIKAIGRLSRVEARWIAVHGKPMSDADVDNVYAAFMPMQLERITRYSKPIPGAVDVLTQLRQRKIKIGSSSGYPREVMNVLLPYAEEHGIVVDHAFAADDLHAGGRPGPWMALANVVELAIRDVRACVKVDDTVPGIREGRTAGMWTVGLSVSGNETGLSLIEWNDASVAEQTTLRDRAVDKLITGGAHYVIDTIAELPEVLMAIEARMAAGEMP
ncbi:phosphonoacetaldehyde hydrolase [Burkholderiaceae bacterium DAT-1]|nr:phosphonoacetaldehyde hydrolase [Burkholderiaceae bacterium DAT-1]